MLYEFKDGLNRNLAARVGKSPRSLAELIEWNQAHAAGEMPWFPQDILVAAEAKGPLSDAAYLQVRQKVRRLAGTEGIDVALSHDHLDVLVAPTGAPAFVNDLVSGDHILGGRHHHPAGHRGLSAYHGADGTGAWPAGRLSFVGPAFSEPALIGVAYAYEQASHARRAPPLPRD